METKISLELLGKNCTKAKKSRNGFKLQALVISPLDKVRLLTGAFFSISYCLVNACIVFTGIGGLAQIQSQIYALSQQQRH